jgi:hypothetical protein
MRFSWIPTAALALALAALSGCHSHWTEPATDADPAGPWGASLDPAERARLIETDALIRAEISAAPQAARLDGDARALGMTDARELAAVLDGDCLRSADVGRFAAARGLGAETAARYLDARFGAATCGASSR